MSPSKDQEYFSAGPIEQQINDLAKVSALKVIDPLNSQSIKGIFAVQDEMCVS